MDVNNGFLINFGVGSDRVTTTTITYPTAFSKLFVLTCGDIISSSDTSGVQYAPAFRSPTITGFSTSQASERGRRINYIGFGT